VRIGINALYLIPGKVGGTETYLRKLVHGLAQVDGDNEYLLYTNRENAGSFSLTAPNFREVRCPLRASFRPARLAWEQSVLPLQARRDRVDVLHSPGYTAPLVLGCAGVVTIHDMNYHFFPADWGRAALVAHRLLIPLVARRTTRILTVSEASRQAIGTVLGVASSKIDVVHSGIDGNLVDTGPADERAVRERHGLSGPFLLSVTASHPHKNLDGLLRIYDRAARDWPAAPALVIVGIKGRQQREIEEAQASRRGPGRVVLAGWVDDRSLSALYRGAAALVFPSKYEGFGFPVLEAMAAGLPVLSSNATSLPELVGDAGLLVDPADEEAMAKALRRLVDDGGLRASLIARGRQRAAAFTWRAAALGTLACYQSALADWQRR
jgi:glycosyltransferase involved in cell wall biosynthesis